MDMSIRFPNLDINLGHIAKSLNFFGYEITVYGMLMAAGMLLGLLVVLTQARRQNQNTNQETEVGKTGHDKCFLRCRDCGRQFIEETDEQIR